MLTLTPLTTGWKNIIPFSDGIDNFRISSENENSLTNANAAMTSSASDLSVCSTSYDEEILTPIEPFVKNMGQNKESDTQRQSTLPDILSTFHHCTSQLLQTKTEPNKQEHAGLVNTQCGESAQAIFKTEPKIETDWKEESRTFTTLTVAKENKLQQASNHNEVFPLSAEEVELYPGATNKEEQFETNQFCYPTKIERSDVLQDACNEVFNDNDECFASPHPDTPLYYSPHESCNYSVPPQTLHSPCSPEIKNPNQYFTTYNYEGQYDSPPYSSAYIPTCPSLMANKCVYFNGKNHYTFGRPVGGPTENINYYVLNDFQNQNNEYRNMGEPSSYINYEGFKMSEEISNEVKQLSSKTGKHKDVELTTVIDFIVTDIKTACTNLQLNTDPQTWTSTQVKKWVDWTVSYNLLPPLDVESFNFPGRILCKMSKNEMLRKAPIHGDILYAYLEIWQAVENGTKVGGVSKEPRKRISGVSETGTSAKRARKLPPQNSQTPPSNEKHDETKTHNTQKFNEEHANTSAINCMTPNHTAGIHLWQFLKELLLQPKAYGQYIRWVDKERGVFKIEDSVEVARLWGIRKNRPAMNYDKLSRSIRQYYKKGIIQKTTVSQRLVYQFVEPSKCLM